LGYISKNWSGFKNGLSLSEKVLDKVKPGIALKNRLESSQKQLQSQITRLEETQKKLQAKHDYIFKKIVDAKLSRNESRAKSYAIELLEHKKVKNMIGNAKLAMEQIQLRLNTVSELGDIVVTLSPCMSLIKGLTPAISSMMPNLNTTMQDLSSMLGDMMTESTSSTEHVFTTDQNNQDITTILDEAHNILEGKTKSSIPEPPSIQNITKEKEYAI
jgi:division protein CdvB (Snf7/Vps24/ESCRT-III family)